MTVEAGLQSEGLSLKDVISDFFFFFVPEWHNLGMGQYDRFDHLEKKARALSVWSCSPGPV